MLRRDLYVGKVVWNTSRFVKTPGTNKRVRRARPESEWRVVPHPELQVVSDEVWQRVQDRQKRLMAMYSGAKKSLLPRSITSPVGTISGVFGFFRAFAARRNHPRENGPSRAIKKYDDRAKDAVITADEAVRGSILAWEPIPGSLWRCKVIESVFVRQCAIARHKEGPLLKEREEYLRYLAARGKRQAQLQDTAMVLLHIIRVMGITGLRNADEAEIQMAGERWAQEDEPHRLKRGNKTSAGRFSQTARGWFRFLGLLIGPATPTCCFDSALKDFVDAMHCSMGLVSETIEHYTPRTRDFLVWAATRHDSLSLVSLQDIDEFLDGKRMSGWQPRTLAAQCQTLRTFFGYAESRGWCKSGLARNIRNPAIRSRDSTASGPSWKDVRRLIKETDGPSKADCRARAILLLCSIYGLRNGEVARLLLNDFDWHSETFTVRRGKRGRTQQFPIQYELGEAVIRYLRNARPQCLCRNLFVTQHPPYRPLKTVGPVIKRRMKRLAIKSHNFGPHALRHACATELLRRGTSLRNIADFLGHRDIRSVSIYAKYDARMLRAVAAFSLAGVR
jgi:integrase/recombinase XerD